MMTPEPEEKKTPTTSYKQEAPKTDLERLKRTMGDVATIYYKLEHGQISQNRCITLAFGALGNVLDYLIRLEESIQREDNKEEVKDTKE